MRTAHGVVRHATSAACLCLSAAVPPASAQGFTFPARNTAALGGDAPPPAATVSVDDDDQLLIAGYRLSFVKHGTVELAGLAALHGGGATGAGDAASRRRVPLPRYAPTLTPFAIVGVFA